MDAVHPSCGAVKVVTRTPRRIGTLPEESELCRYYDQKENPSNEDAAGEEEDSQNDKAAVKI